MKSPSGPAYRIETARTRLRCYAPSDYVHVNRAIAESLEHLRPFMPWTLHEPMSEERRIEWLRTQRGHFDLGGDYTYGIFDKSETRLLGSTGLHLRGDVDERDIGYWIHVNEVGQGLATEVTSALIRVGFELDRLDTINIRCTPENTKSARIPQKLGFSGPEIEESSLPMPGEGKVDAHVYSLSRVEYATSPARRVSLEAYDVLDRRLI